MLRFSCEYVARGPHRRPNAASPIRPGESNRGLIAALGLVVLLVAVGVGVWYVWNKREKGGGPGPGGGGDEAPEVSPTALLPGNAQMVASIRSQELYAMPAARKALEQMRKANP